MKKYKLKMLFKHNIHLGTYEPHLSMTYCGGWIYIAHADKKYYVYLDREVREYVVRLKF